MNRGREHIVKVMQGSRTLQPLPVEQAWRLLPFGQCLGHQGTQEDGGVDPAIEPLAQIDASGHQIQRRTDHCRALDELCSRLLLQPGPARQGIAAQRDAGRIKFTGGARAQALREALRRLAQLPGTRLSRASSFYETAPWGKTDQPPFLNGAACLSTRLAPEALLAACQEIERALGRVRHEHWGARTIDIDLLYIAGVSLASPELVLPHPYLTQRAFVLRPLADIASELVIEGRPVREWCRSVEDQEVSPAAELSDPWPLSMIACIDEGRDAVPIGRPIANLSCYILDSNFEPVPLGVLGATFFFGFAATLANASQAEPALQAIPEVILKVFPYVVTLLALILFSKSTQAPRAAGEPFEKGKR